MIEQIDNVYDRLQVTVEFHLEWPGVLERNALAERVRECLRPLIKQNIRSGRACLPGLIVIRFAGNKEFMRDEKDVHVLWQAHLPWWAADNPDWSRVPSIGWPGTVLKIW